METNFEILPDEKLCLEANFSLNLHIYYRRGVISILVRTWN